MVLCLQSLAVVCMINSIRLYIGTAIQAWQKAASDLSYVNQLWLVQRTDRDTYTFRNVGSGIYMTLVNGVSAHCLLV